MDRLRRIEKAHSMFRALLPEVPGFEVANWDSRLAPRGMAAIPSAPDVSRADIPQRIAQFAPIVKATGATPN